MILITAPLDRFSSHLNPTTGLLCQLQRTSKAMTGPATVTLQSEKTDPFLLLLSSIEHFG